MTAPIKMVCAHCGGTNVQRDAWAKWDEDNQEWVLGSVFDDAHCDDCDGEANIEEQPVALFFTVIVLHPDYADQASNGWAGTYQAHVLATSPEDAIEMARMEAALSTGRDLEAEECNCDPSDWGVVAVFQGHLRTLSPTP